MDRAGVDRADCKNRIRCKTPFMQSATAFPAKAGERYFPSALVSASAVKGKPFFRFSADDSFTFEKAEKREKQVMRWFKEVKPVLFAAENPVCFGEDFARSGDLTVLHCDEELSDGSADTFCVIELRNIPYFDGAAFDSRGNGQIAGLHIRFHYRLFFLQSAQVCRGQTRNGAENMRLRMQCDSYQDTESRYSNHATSFHKKTRADCKIRIHQKPPPMQSAT